MTKQWQRQILEVNHTQDELNRLRNTKSYYVGTNGAIQLYKPKDWIYRLKRKIKALSAN